MVASRNGREGLELKKCVSRWGSRLLTPARLEWLRRAGDVSSCGFRLEMRSGVSKWGGPIS
eukprot:2812383-Prymnesium_polylepis.2